MPLRRLAVQIAVVTTLLMLGGGANALAAGGGSDGSDAGGGLPQACVDAGATTAAACRALQRHGKPKGDAAEAPAANAPDATQPEAIKPEAAAPEPAKPAMEKPAIEKPAIEKPQAPKPGADATEAASPKPRSEAAGGSRQRLDCTDPDAANTPACARQHRRGASGGAAAGAGDAPAAVTPAAPAPAKEQTLAPPAMQAAPKSPAAALPADCVAAGITSERACRRFEAGHPGVAGSPKPATPAAGATSAVPVAPIAPPETPAASPTQDESSPLSKRCVAAGIDSKAACDAYEAANGKRNGGGRASGTPGGQAAPAGGGAVQPVTPAAPPVPGNAATPPAAPAAGAAATTPATPTAAGGPLPPDCLAVGISTAGQCDAFQARRHRKGGGTAGQQSGGQQGAGQQPANGQQPLEPVAKLPPGVQQDQLAPLLDSAKQREIGGGGRNSQPSAAAGPKGPPPSNDEAAQSRLRVRKAPPLTPPGATPAGGTPPTGQIELPQDVTVVNQTVVNTTVNTTTINDNGAMAGAPGRPGRPGGHGGPGGPGMMPPGGFPSAFPPPPGEPMRQGSRRPNPIGLAVGAVLQLGDRLIVDSSGRDQYRISGGDRDKTDYSQLPGNRYMETIYRPGGVRIVTIYDRDGDILRRSRFDQDGHETVLAYFDYRDDRDLGQWRDAGADLPPLQLDVDVNDYVLDGSQADARSLARFLGRPPVESVPRLYSIDEVERSARLRDIMPRVELADLTFDTGSASLAPDQVDELSGVAQAMLALLQRNPAETFLIEGHTDAVGSPASNLVLSDARAAAVAQILTDVYRVPPENLATQGYGAEFLRIQTASAERLNRRVVVRRITPLVTIANSGD